MLSKEPTIDSPITYFNFRFRTKKILHREGIYYLKELIQLSETQILQFKNAGINTLNDIQNQLNKINLQLKITESINNQRCILIPEDISDLEFKNIFLMFDGFIKLESHNPVTKLLNQFKIIGDLNNHTYVSLKKIRGIGVRSIDILLDWYKGLHVGKYYELVELLDDYSIKNISDIDCSPFLLKFLNKNGIKKVGDIAKLDYINTQVLIENEKICLFELRTLHCSESYLKTKCIVKGENIDFVQIVEDFLLSYCEDRWGSLMIKMWNSGKKHLSEVAIGEGLTRERIRQIIRQQIRQRFILHFIYNENYFEKYFLKIMLENFRPIKLKDLTENNVNKIHNDSFYLGFLNNIFPHISFWGFKSKKGERFDYYKNEIYRGIKDSYGISIRDFLNGKSVEDKIDILNVIFHSEYWFDQDGDINPNYSNFRIKENNGDRIIKLKFESSEAIVYEILKNSDKSLTFNEICYKINNSGFNKKMVPRNLLSIHFRNEDILRLDRYEYGLQKHLAYDSTQFENIQSLCVQYLRKIGHQSSASSIYNKIKEHYPNLRSKYELVIIIRESTEICDLGFFNFGLAKWDLEERIKISQVISELFKNDSRPKSKDEIVMAITEVRTFRPEGLPNIMKQLGHINYPPGYFGLMDHHEENLKYLFNLNTYFEDFIKYKMFDTSLDSIKDYFLIDDETEIEKRIDSIGSLLIVKDPYSSKRFVIRKLGNNKRLFENEIRSIIRTVLFNSTKPLTIEELKYFCIMSPSKNRDSWFYLQKTFDRKIVKIIKSDNRYEVLSDRSILFSGDKMLNTELLDIKDEIVQYLESLNTAIKIDELFSIVGDLSEALESPNELGYLLETDDRLIIKNGFVELKRI